MTLMHRRTCHTGVSVLTDMVKNKAAEGLEYLRSQKVKYDVCDECCAGKATVAPHKQE